MKTADNARKYNDSVDIGRVLNIILKARYKILWVSLVLGLLFLLYDRVRTPVWNVSTILTFANNSKGFNLANLSSGESANISMYSSILKSNRVLKSVIKKYDLDQLSFVKKLNITERKNSNIIEFSYVGEDKKLIRNILLDLLHSFTLANKDLNLPGNYNEIEAYDISINEKKDKLKKLELELEKMLSDTATSLADEKGMFKIIEDYKIKKLEKENLESQLNDFRKRFRELQNDSNLLPNFDPGMEAWRKKIINTKLKLNNMKLTYGDSAPAVVKLRKELDNLNDEFKREINNFSKALDKGFTEKFSQLFMEKVGLETTIAGLEKLIKQTPADTIKVNNLTRDIAILNVVLQELIKKREMYQLETIKNPNKWQVLDNAVISDRPLNKKPILMTLLGILIGFLLSTIYFVRNSSKNSIVT